MSCLLPWPPEMYSLLCLRWEKSLPTDLRVLRGSTDSLHVQTHQMLSGVCLLSAGVFLVCRKTTRMQLEDRKLNSPLLSDRWVSPSWIYFCNSLCRKHVPLRITISRGFLKTTTTSLQSAQGFLSHCPKSSTEDLLAVWITSRWHSLPKFRCLLSSLSQNSLSKLAHLSHFESFCIRAQKACHLNSFQEPTSTKSFLSIKAASLDLALARVSITIHLQFLPDISHFRF